MPCGVLREYALLRRRSGVKGWDCLDRCLYRARSDDTNKVFTTTGPPPPSLGGYYSVVMPLSGFLHEEEEYRVDVKQHVHPRFLRLLLLVFVRLLSLLPGVGSPTPHGVLKNENNGP